jgi:hypothetical protein
MSPFQEALINLLRALAEDHIDNGLNCDEAISLGIVEARRMMRGTNLTLEARFISDALQGIHYTREPGTRH